MAKSKQAPFLPVDRSFFESELWLGQTFTEAAAWVDLNYLAAYEDTAVYFAGRRYNLQRGQLVTTTSELAKRWKWTRDKVKRQLRKWARPTPDPISAPICAPLAHHQRTNACTIITVDNYPNFDLSRTTSRTICAPSAHHLRPDSAPISAFSSINKRNKEIRNNNQSNDDDNGAIKRTETGAEIIDEYVDPRTGEEMVVIRP